MQTSLSIYRVELLDEAGIFDGREWSKFCEYLRQDAFDVKVGKVQVHFLTRPAVK